MTRPDILCIGSVLWDIIGRADQHLPAGSDVPGRITRQPGGVALNIAVALRRCGLRPALLSAVGQDGDGTALVAACRRLGLITGLLHRPADMPTDRYIAIEGAQGLVAAVADARTLDAAGAQILAPLGDGRLGTADRPWPGVIVLDGNLGADLLAESAVSPLFTAADLRVASASPAKARHLRGLLPHPNVTLYLNLEEARMLCQTGFGSAPDAALGLLAQGATRVLVTDGGRACADGCAGRGIVTALPPAVPVRRVTGAGDAFMAAHVAAERRGAGRGTALEAALRAAADHIAGESRP